MGFEMLLPGLLGGLGGLAGGGMEEPSLTPQQQQIYKALLAMSRRDRKFARSNPLSTSQERQGLANTLGLQNQGANRVQQGLFGQMSGTDLTNPSTADAMKNLGQANLAQQSSIYSDAYQQGFARRDAARDRAAGLLGQAGSIAGNPAEPGYGSSMSQMLPFINQLGYQWGLGRGAGGGNAVNGQRVDGMGNAYNPTPGTTSSGGFIPIQRFNGGQGSIEDDQNTWF